MAGFCLLGSLGLHAASPGPGPLVPFVILPSIAFGLVAAPVAIAETWGRDQARLWVPMLLAFLVALVLVAAGRASQSYWVGLLQGIPLEARIEALGAGLTRLGQDAFAWASAGASALMFAGLVLLRLKGVRLLAQTVAILGVGGLHLAVVYWEARTISPAYSLSASTVVGLAVLPAVEFPTSWALADWLNARIRSPNHQEAVGDE